MEKISNQIKKRLGVGLLLTMLLAALSACSPYQILEEPVTLTKKLDYQDIYVGWLDYEEENWQKFGYESQEAWAVAINEMNVLGLHVWLKDWLSDKNFDHAKSKDFSEPDKGLFVKFSDCTLASYGGYAEIVVEFIDAESKDVLWKSKVSVSAPQGWGFEQTLNNLTYNFATFVYEKITS